MTPVLPSLTGFELRSEWPIFKQNEWEGPCAQPVNHNCQKTGRLLTHYLYNQLTLARSVVEINKNDLLPCTQAQSSVHEGHREGWA
jgi:hypothetical protein